MSPHGRPAAARRHAACAESAEAASVILEDSVVRDIRGGPDGGVGLFTQSSPYGSIPALLDVSRSVIDHTEHSGEFLLGADATLDRMAVIDTRGTGAGAATFGAELKYSGSAMLCGEHDVFSSPVGSVGLELVDEGRNACGCPDATDTCRVTRDDVAAPGRLAQP